MNCTAIWWLLDHHCTSTPIEVSWWRLEVHEYLQSINIITLWSISQQKRKGEGDKHNKCCNGRPPLVFQIESSWPEHGNEPNIWSGFNCWWTSSITKGVPSYLLTTILIVQQRFALITPGCAISAMFVILELDTQKSSVLATMNRCLETYSGIYCSPRVLEVATLKSFCQTNDGTCRNLQVTPAHVPIQGMAGCRYFFKEFSITVSNTDGIQNENRSTLCLRFDF